MRLALFTFLLASGLAAQDGRQLVPPESLHQYSAISPVSAAGDKLHVFDLQGNARIVKMTDGSTIATGAPFPEAHWDNTDDDLLWVVGLGQPNIRTWRPSSGTYTTVIDYSGRFQSITTGATTDITWDNWEAFWAPSEHTLCAVDLTAKKTYCVDVNVADPLNHLPLATPDVDYVAVTPRDSVSHLHYVLMLANPAMGIFSVDETAGVLRWVVRPELVVPLMGSGKGNNDGNCDPGEACATTGHGDIYTAPDGQVYFQGETAIDGQIGSNYHCESGQGLTRLNAGLKMTTLESAGGGLKYVTDYPCGVDWSSQHSGCNRWGGHCIVSFDTPAPQAGQAVPKKNELWLLGLDASGAMTYSRLGQTSSDYVNANSDFNLAYYAQSRAAMSMDGTQVVFDSDMGSAGAQNAVYGLASGLAAVKQPGVSSPPAPATIGVFAGTGDKTYCVATKGSGSAPYVGVSCRRAGITKCNANTKDVSMFSCGDVLWMFKTVGSVINYTATVNDRDANGTVTGNHVASQGFWQF